MLRATVALGSMSVLFWATPVIPGLTTVWPIERILANLEERLASAPNSNLRYDLGRVHAWAFALECESLRVQGDPPRPVLGFVGKERDCGAVRAPSSADEQIEHLRRAVAHLRRAVKFRPAIGARRLTLAWILENGSHLADRFDNVELFDLQSAVLTNEDRKDLGELVERMCSVEDRGGEAALAALMEPANLEAAVVRLGNYRLSPDASVQSRISRLLTRYWIERSIESYRTAFEHALGEEIRKDGETRYVSAFRSQLASWEAGSSYVRLVRSRGPRPEEESRLSETEATLRSIEGMDVRMPLSPILLSLERCETLDALIAPELHVPFDLDGDAVDELWPWIAPHAGWLVWDPERKGEIVSGEQLFGTASAWLFFEDGYRVLDALDDDGDGALRGTELAGIAVWFDRDTDGISDRGEVVPVEELGIAALATQATLRIGDSPANLCGVEMSDGRVLPSYDWVLAPAMP